MRGWQLAGAAMALAFTATAHGQGEDLGTPVNQPGTNWTIYGALAEQKAVKDADVNGGYAMKVTVKSKGANVWDVGASSPVQKPIKRGDRLLLAFYAKAPAAAEGTTIKLPAMVQLAKEPFSAVIQGTVEVGPKWALVHVMGNADKDYPGGTVQAMAQLAGDKQVVELGPVYVFDKPAG